MSIPGSTTSATLPNTLSQHTPTYVNPVFNSANVTPINSPDSLLSPKNSLCLISTPFIHKEAETYFETVRKETTWYAVVNSEEYLFIAKSITPYVGYGIILPKIKEKVETMGDSFLKTIVLSTITFIEFVPFCARAYNSFGPFFDSSLLNQDPIKLRRPPSKEMEHSTFRYKRPDSEKFGLGYMAYDKFGFPVHDSTGLPIIVFSNNKTFSDLAALASLIASSSVYTAFESAIKAAAIYRATNSYKKTCFYRVYEHKVRTLQKLSEDYGFNDETHIPFIKSYLAPSMDKHLVEAYFENLLAPHRCQLSGRIAIIPVNCKCDKVRHLFSNMNVAAWLLGHDQCPIGNQPLSLEDLEYNTETFIFTERILKKYNEFKAAKSIEGEWLDVNSKAADR